MCARAPTSFESMAQRYLGTAVTDQNLFHEEIKRRLNLGNTCYQSFQNLLSSYLLSEIVTEYTTL
jgi:hypothetical protein